MFILGVLEKRPAADLTEIGGMHRYSFSLQGKIISGRSHSPFEKANGYFARVEACRIFGIEGIFSTAACYITLRPYVNMTVSNSDNYTSAVYDDGKVATICCMYIGDDYESPIYRIALPPGLIKERTYERNSEIHIMLDIPDIDENHRLDAIWFSPGQGIAPVLFPIKDRTMDNVFNKAFVEAHLHDPLMQKMIQDLIRLKARLKARDEINRGLTYGP